MFRSKSVHTSRARTGIDWRGWIALAWVIWFGLAYASMVVEKRGGKIQAMFRSAASKASE